jgi:hypothetical protein
MFLTEFQRFAKRKDIVASNYVSNPSFWQAVRETLDVEGEELMSSDDTEYEYQLGGEDEIAKALRTTRRKALKWRDGRLAVLHAGIDAHDPSNLTVRAGNPGLARRLAPVKDSTRAPPIGKPCNLYDKDFLRSEVRKSERLYRQMKDAILIPAFVSSTQISI